MLRSNKCIVSNLGGCIACTQLNFSGYGSCMGAQGAHLARGTNSPSVRHLNSDSASASTCASVLFQCLLHPSQTFELGKRTVHSIVGSGLFPPSPTIGNFYPRFRGTALQGCGHGENDPIRAECCQDLPALSQFGQRFRAPGSTGCNPSRQYSPCSPSARCVAWNYCGRDGSLGGTAYAAMPVRRRCNHPSSEL